MYSRISQVMDDGTQFGGWDGFNNAIYQTSNRLIKKWRSGKDSKLNSVTVKQLAKYNPEKLGQYLWAGIVITYQSHAITLKRVANNSVYVEAVNLSTGGFSNGTLSQKTMKDLVVDNGTVSHDVLDVLQALYEKVLR